MKQLRSTLVLLVLALLVGGYIFWNERGPAVQEGNTVLLRTNSDAVHVVQLLSGDSGVQLSRNGERWQVAKLVNGKAQSPVPADDDVIKPLLNALQLVQSDTLVSGGDVKAFGLDSPQKKLVVDGQTIELGISPSFEPNRVYARVGGRIALVPIGLSQISASPFDVWRDKHLLSFNAATATNLRIQSPALKADLQKQGDDWKITQPLPVAADDNTVGSLLSLLSTTSISRWLDDEGKDAAKWGLNAPTATIHVGDATLTVGKKQSAGYAARSDTSHSVFLLPDAIFASWNKPLNAWRSKSIVPVKSTELTQIILSARGASKILVKTGDKWTLKGQEPTTEMNSRTLDVAYFATGLQATDFIDHPVSLQTYGLDTPELTLDLVGNERIVLKIGSARSKHYASTGRSTVYVLAPDALEIVQNALDAFFPKPKTASDGKK